MTFANKLFNQSSTSTMAMVAICILFAGFVLAASSLSNTKISLMNVRSLIAARDENQQTNWNTNHIDQVRAYLKTQDLQHSIFMARSDIALMINMLGGFTTFEDVQTAVNGQIVSVERRAVSITSAPTGYKLVKVPDLFPMDDSLKFTGWERSIK